MFTSGCGWAFPRLDFIAPRGYNVGLLNVGFGPIGPAASGPVPDPPCGPASGDGESAAMSADTTAGGPLDPPIRLLMGPGPSAIHPRVLQAMGKPTVGHLDPYYLQLMNGLQHQLRAVFRTQNPMTFAVSGTGSAGMEAAVVNLIEPGDAVVVCVNGVFGARMAEVARRCGGQVTVIERPWGEVFTPADLEPVLASVRPKMVGIVMAETSTGAWQPIDKIASLVHDSGAMLAVDAVTSLGGVPVDVDRWKADVVYSGSQIGRAHV